MEKTKDDITTGNTVRIVGCSWADSSISRYRASVRSIHVYGKGAFASQYAVIAWKGTKAKQLASEFGTKFMLEELRKV